MIQKELLYVFISKPSAFGPFGWEQKLEDLEIGVTRNAWRTSVECCRLF